MIELQAKLARVRRLCEVDRSQLTAYVIELAKSEASLQQAQQQVTKTKDELHRASTEDLPASITARHQSALFANHLVQQLGNLQSTLVEVRELRDARMQSVIQQQTRIKGWESLIDKLNHELSLEQQKQDSLIADDRYLSNLAGRNS